MKDYYSKVGFSRRRNKWDYVPFGSTVNPFKQGEEDSTNPIITSSLNGLVDYNKTESVVTEPVCKLYPTEYITGNEEKILDSIESCSIGSSTRDCDNSSNLIKKYSNGAVDEEESAPTFSVFATVKSEDDEESWEFFDENIEEENKLLLNNNNTSNGVDDDGESRKLDELLMQIISDPKLDCLGRAIRKRKLTINQILNLKEKDLRLIGIKDWDDKLLILRFLRENRRRIYGEVVPTSVPVVTEAGPEKIPGLPYDRALLVTALITGVVVGGLLINLVRKSNI